MGEILDGTYSAIDGLYRFFISPEGQPVVEQIYGIARSVAKKEKTADDGVAEIADLLPADLGAAIRQIGSKNPLTVFLVLLAIFTGISSLVSNIASVYKVLSPDAPNPPSIIINDKSTVINQSASGYGGNQANLDQKSRPQSRQHERAEEAEQQRAGPIQREPPAETGSASLMPRQKPKARDRRRWADAERRRTFNPRHQKSPSCD